MQSCVGPSTSSQQATSSSNQPAAAAAAKHQTDLRQTDLGFWQTTGVKSSQSQKPSQSQASASRNSQQSQQPAAEVKRKVPEWMSAASSSKTATKKKLKNSSLFS